MCRVARPRWSCQFVSDAPQVLTKRSKSIRAHVAPQDDLAIRRHGHNQVGKLKAAVFLALADECVSFAKDVLKDSGRIRYGLCHSLRTSRLACRLPVAAAWRPGGVHRSQGSDSAGGFQTMAVYRAEPVDLPYA